MFLRRLATMVLMGLAIAMGAARAFAGYYQLTLQPIQICNDAGAGCANPERRLFESITDTIWAQAGIDAFFLPWHTYNSTSFLDLSTPPEPPDPWAPNEFDSLRGDPALYGGSANAMVVNVWFANLLDGDLGFYGIASFPGRAIAIGWNAVDDPDPEGFDRIDALAHEIGHNLGLDHVGINTRLMAIGDVRLVPETGADVYPTGNLDQLVAAEIATARASPLLLHIPEPGALVLLSIGFICIGLQRFHRH